jgi:DNA-binding transcriptional MerR regulator
MNISEAAEKSGLTAVTLRYYERIGLIPPVTRGNGGVRLYKESDLGWIDFIKCMRNAGLSIECVLQDLSTQYCKEKVHTFAPEIFL